MQRIVNTEINTWGRACVNDVRPTNLQIAHSSSQSHSRAASQLRLLFAHRDFQETFPRNFRCTEKNVRYPAESRQCASTPPSMGFRTSFLLGSPSVASTKNHQLPFSISRVSSKIDIPSGPLALPGDCGGFVPRDLPAANSHAPCRIMPS